MQYRLPRYFTLVLHVQSPASHTPLPRSALTHTAFFPLDVPQPASTACDVICCRWCHRVETMTCWRTVQGGADAGLASSVSGHVRLHADVSSAGYKYLASRMKKNEEKDPEAGQQAHDSFLSQLDMLEGLLGKHAGPYLVGWACMRLLWPKLPVQTRVAFQQIQPLMNPPEPHPASMLLYVLALCALQRVGLTPSMMEDVGSSI